MVIDLNIFYTSLVAVVIMIAVGFALGKAKWVNKSTNKRLINILLMVVMPCALFGAFPDTFQTDTLSRFLWGLGAGALVFVAMIIVSKVLFSKRFNPKNYYEYQFAFIFNNAVFLGYPLVSTLFGADGLMAYAGFVLVFNLMLFGYGVMLFEKRFTAKHVVKAVVNPNVIAIILGAVFFLLSVQLPSALSMPIGYVGGVMTPLSLICIGYMLSTAKLSKILGKKMLVITCIAQLVLGPLIAYGLMKLIGAPDNVLHVIVLIQALPTATTLGLFAEKYGGDTTNASELVAVSTVLSAVTLPILMLLVLNVF